MLFLIFNKKLSKKEEWAGEIGYLIQWLPRVVPLTRPIYNDENGLSFVWQVESVKHNIMWLIDNHMRS